MKKGRFRILFCVLLTVALLPVPVPAEEPLLLQEEDVQALSEFSEIPVADVNALPAGACGITFRGTVVWAEGDAAIVQDGSGGIWVSPCEGVSPGDILLVSGQTGQEAFLAEDVTRMGTGPLPAMEATLDAAPEEVRIVIRGGVLSAGVLTQGACSVEVRTSEPHEGTADVYGILREGVLYADTIVSAGKPNREWQAYFGLLDAHSDLSDGLGTVEEAFSCAAQAGNLDFFAVTDHSSCLDSAKWAAGKQAAAGVTNEHFVGIFGYEMTWSPDKTVGHINTFATDRWLTGADTLADYCAALRKQPGQVSQFNHPGPSLGDFGGFADYDPACDACVQLLQVEGEGGESYYSYYIQALDWGWHVAPTVGQDNHCGNWGAEGLSRTAVLAKNLSESALYEAMAARRVYATEDPDLYIDYRLNGNPMGAVMGVAAGLEASVLLDDPTDGPAALVEVIGSGGSVLASGNASGGLLILPVPRGFPYYFLRITQPDGDTAVTAPVWVDDFTDMGILNLTADPVEPLAGGAVTLTLELYNREEIPFRVTSASLYRGTDKLGDFTAAGALRYTFPLLWNDPGSVRLTAVVQGTANGQARRYEQNLTLYFGVPDPVKASIRQARHGDPGTVFAVEGYATTGNANPYTTFSDRFFVQDSTGGIPVRGELSQTVQIGTPLAVTGVLREENGERYLELTDCRIQNKEMYRCVPLSLSCREAMDYASRGGSLVQTEGTVVSVTASGKSVSRFTIRDSRGDSAEILIDPEIRSGTYGVNELSEVVKPDILLRVIALLSRDDAGLAVLRVRNCDEVTAVPTADVVADESNPRTGERCFLRSFADILW